MDQAKNWDEFRDACSYSNIPGENMVWADKKGNIGWQAVGIAPVRNNFSGLVPIPGDGSYEWDGYLPIMEKPIYRIPKRVYRNSKSKCYPRRLRALECNRIHLVRSLPRG